MNCPQIVLPGWWWKKHFASYRQLRATMQDMLDFQWKNGMREEHERVFEKMLRYSIDMSTRAVFDAGFKPDYK